STGRSCLKKSPRPVGTRRQQRTTLRSAPRTTGSRTYFGRAWSRRARIQILPGRECGELALFNLAIDSKLRSCDLVKVRIREGCHGSVVAALTMVMQQKTQRPVQFEITEQHANHC